MLSSRPVAIVGVYATAQRRTLPGRTSTDLAIESVKGALTDAGLTTADVDGVAVDWAGPTGHIGYSTSWARLLGHPIKYMTDSTQDNAGPEGVLKAAAAVSAGLCDVVVVGGGKAGRTAGPVAGGRNSGGGFEFMNLYGAHVMPQFALVAQRHMYQFGTTPQQIASVAATIRNNGSINSEAVMHARGPYTVDDVLASRMVASPLHLLECAIVAEGGAALVITTLERARDLRHAPAMVLGGAMEYFQAGYVNPPLYREIGHIGRNAARRALDMGGVSVNDIDVFCLYDPTAFEVIRQFEMLGLCGEGEGGPFVETGTIDLDGEFPVNPDGGTLAHSYVGTQQMTLRVIEVVRQLRGSAVNQLDAPEVGIATVAGSGAQHIELVVLGKG